jgi:hypothetical protein
MSASKQFFAVDDSQLADVERFTSGVLPGFNVFYAQLPLFAQHRFKKLLQAYYAGHSLGSEVELQKLQSCAEKSQRNTGVAFMKGRNTQFDFLVRVCIATVIGVVTDFTLRLHGLATLLIVFGARMTASSLSDRDHSNQQRAKPHVLLVMRKQSDLVRELLIVAAARCKIVFASQTEFHPGDVDWALGEDLYTTIAYRGNLMLC